MKFKLYLYGVLFDSGFLISATATQRLGCERAGFGSDVDIIQVGRKEGRYRALRLVVQGNKIDLRDVKVVFSNGDTQHLRMQNEIRDSEKSTPADLDGDRRAIDRSELVYSSKPSFKGMARVCVEGLEYYQ